MNAIAIGVDIGGSHISCAASNLAEKVFLPETFSEKKIDNQAPAEVILAIWANTIRETIRKTGQKEIAGIGFAMPGPFDYLNGIALFNDSIQKYQNLYGLNIASSLRNLLGIDKKVPVRFINDATAFALGENWLGKLSGSEKSLAITLGTGFGSAFLSQDLPVVKGDTVPETGAVWHLAFENGIADDYFSTRGLMKSYELKTGILLQGVKELAHLALTDKVAKDVFSEFGYKLAMFLHPWIEKSGSEAIVIGGNISNAFHLFGNEMLAYYKTNSVDVKVEISTLKESASLIGSATLVDNLYYNRISSLIAEM